MEAMKRFCWIICAAAFLVTGERTAVLADQSMDMSAAQTDAMPYVIKVTPTLAYLDIGSAMGAVTGQLYLIVRFTDSGSHVWVGEARIIRTFLDFSIAEIVSTVEGEQIEMLQRAISMENWEAMSEMPSVTDGTMARVRGFSTCSSGAIGAKVWTWRDCLPATLPVSTASASRDWDCAWATSLVTVGD